LKSSIVQHARVSVHDVLGRAVLSFTFDILNSRFATSLDVSGLSSGVYLVRFETRDRTLSRQFVISR